MDDHELGKLLIVTQTSHASPAGTRKHPGGDRTGNFLSRAKVTAEIAKTINDGLYFYEQVCIVLPYPIQLKFSREKIFTDYWSHKILNGKNFTDRHVKFANVISLEIIAGLCCALPLFFVLLRLNMGRIVDFLLLSLVFYVSFICCCRIFISILRGRSLIAREK